MEHHVRDPKTGLWRRNGHYWKEERKKELKICPKLDGVEPSRVDKLDPKLDDSMWVVSSNLKQSQRLIRRGIELLPNAATWMVKSAYDLVLDFLEDSRAKKHEAVNPQYLYLLAGYGDPPNRQLGNLVAYTLKERHERRLVTWLFTPVGVDSIDKVWGREITPLVMQMLPTKLTVGGNTVEGTTWIKIVGEADNG